MTRLARLLYQLRKARGLTQGQLATYAKVSRSYITKLEAGKISLPSIQVLNRLANELHANREELLKAAADILPADEIPALDDPELILYLDEIGNFPKHDQEIIKGVLRGIREAHQKYGTGSD